MPYRKLLTALLLLGLLGCSQPQEPALSNGSSSLKPTSTGSSASKCGKRSSALTSSASASQVLDCGDRVQVSLSNPYVLIATRNTGESDTQLINRLVEKQLKLYKTFFTCKKCDIPRACLQQASFKIGSPRVVNGQNNEVTVSFAGASASYGCSKCQ